MNACATIDEFEFSHVASPARSKPELNARPSTRTPAQERLEMRVQQFAQSVIEALEDADSQAPSMGVRAHEIMQLAILLPFDVPVVDSYITPSGSLCFDWDEDPSNQLSIMLQAGGRIAYAAYFDGDRVNGSCRFGGKLSEDLTLVIRRWKQRGAGTVA